MPIYDYLCTTCGAFEERRPMSESRLEVPCRVCDVPAPRLPAAPRLNLMSSNNRIAETRNEKSAHEPDVVHTLAPHGGHPHGHSHAGASRHRKPVHEHSHGPGPTPRPWMVGH